MSYYGSRSTFATFKAKDLGDDPPHPQYKVGPIFCFCFIFLDLRTMKWILKPTFFFTKLSDTIETTSPKNGKNISFAYFVFHSIIKVGPQDFLSDLLLRKNN